MLGLMAIIRLLHPPDVISTVSTLKRVYEKVTMTFSPEDFDVSNKKPSVANLVGNVFVFSGCLVIGKNTRNITFFGIGWRVLYNIELPVYKILSIHSGSSSRTLSRGLVQIRSRWSQGSVFLLLSGHIKQQIMSTPNGSLGRFSWDLSPSTRLKRRKANVLTS